MRERQALSRRRLARPGGWLRLFRDFVEGAWKEAHFEGYKPSTRKGVRSTLDRQLLPAFGSKPLDRIALAQVTQWFDRFSRTAPGNANHALDLLTQIVNFAIERGHLGRQPGAVRATEPETGAHALSVPGGDRPAPSGPRQADPQQQP